MVTGKNKVQFEEWYVKEFCNDISFMLYSDEIKLFNSLHFEMQIGVYLAYYDSKGIFVDSEKSYDLIIKDLTDEFESGFWYKKDYHSTKGYFKTRPEAYKEAFKQADKLINEKI